METKKYNGWTNYETWLVNLWMDNEQSTYEYFREQAEKIRDASDLSDMIKDHFEESAPELTGFWSDLLNSALSEVNWYEIAEHLVAGLDPIEEDSPSA